MATETGMQTIANQVEVGRKIRHWRHAKNMTLLELAEKVGCSESLLSKIENDRVRPSIGILHRLVAALGANFSMLFQDHGPDTELVLHEGERLRITAHGMVPAAEVQMENLIPGARSKLLQASIHIIPPGGGTEGMIEHVGEEVGYVLAGSLELTVGTRTITIRAGDSFHFRSDVPHGFRNTGDTVARVVWVSTPPTF